MKGFRLLAYATFIGLLSGMFSAVHAACPLPYQMSNGQVPDASQMMANFNALAACLTPGGSTNSIQYNAGSGAFGGVGPLTDGQMVIGSAAGAPQAQTLTPGSGISITNAPGAITIASTLGTGGSGLYRQVLSATPTTSSTGLGTWLNQGSCSTTDSTVGVSITAPSSATNNICGRYRAAPSPPYKITVLLGMTRNNSASMLGIGWYDGTSKLQLLSYENNAAPSTVLRVRQFSSPTSANTVNFLSNQIFFSQPIWFQLQDDGANVYFAFSQDGVNFMTLYSVAKSSGYLGSGGYSNIILWANPFTSSSELATLLSWTQT